MGIEERGVSGRFMSGLGWSLAGEFAGQGSGMLAGIAAARLLGREGFGKYGLVFVTLQLFSTAAGFGQGLTAATLISECRKSDPMKAGRIAGVSLAAAAASGGLLALALFAMAGWISESMMGGAPIASELRLASAWILFNSVRGASVGVLSGLEAFRRLSRLNVVRGVATFALVAGGAAAGSTRGAVVGLTAAAGLVCASAVAAAARACRDAGMSLSLGMRGAELAELFHFRLPAIVSSLIPIPALWYCNALVARLPDGAAQMGLLTAARQWQGVLTFLPIVAANVALPILSSSFDGRRNDEESVALELTHSLTQAAVWGVSAPLILAAPVIMTLFGGGFEEGQRVMIFLVGGTAIGFLGNAMGPLMAVRRKMWQGSLLNFAFAAVTLAVVMGTIARAGASSLGYAALAGYGLIMPATVLYLRSHRIISAELTWRALASAAAMAAFTLLCASSQASGHPFLVRAAAVAVAAAGLMLGTTSLAAARFHGAVTSLARRTAWAS